MTTFSNNEPCEFIRIENWLAERAQFTQISAKKFFANFRTWKILRMWRLNILSARRELVTANLKARLFIADPVFSNVLVQHRTHCKDLEKQRVLDLNQPSRDAFNQLDFQERQATVRKVVESAIRDASDKTRAAFESGRKTILEGLQLKIQKQEELDQNEATAARTDGAGNNRANQGANEFRLMRQIEKLDKAKTVT
jgi:hypothetical protein